MKLEDGQLRWKATDLSDFSACRHKTVLERDHAFGRKVRPGRADPAMKLLQERGIEHEGRFLEVLEERHGERAHRVTVPPPRTVADWTQATEQTVAAMRARHRIIYQAPLALGPWSGFADFLVRRDHSPDEPHSGLGDFHYEVVDTKLAQEARGSAVLQLCVYSEVVGTLQRRVPDRFFVASPHRVMRPGLAPDAHEHEFRTSDFLAYFRLIRARFTEFAQALDLEEPYPEPVEHCDVCAWWEHCDKRRQDDDHLSLVAGMARSHRRLLSDAGIATLTALGELAPDTAQRPRKLPLESFSRLQHQARLQLEAKTAPPRFDLLPVELGRGLCRLPEPDHWDVFFDIEADRYAPDGTFHYLMGWVVVDAAGKSTYEGLWARTRSEEQENFERFVDWVTERRRTHPGMRIYHFAPFEKTALGEMSLRFLSREAEVDALLRDQVLVDLMPVVKQGLRAGIDSYSIKELEQFYGYVRGIEPRKAARDRRRFELHRLDDEPIEPPDVVPAITDYNREDCESTYFLRKFLEEQRASWIDKGEDVPRPVPRDPTDLKEKKAWDLRVEDLRQRLLSPIPEDLEQWSDAEQAGFTRMVGSRFLWAWNAEFCDGLMCEYSYEKLVQARRDGTLDALLGSSVSDEVYGDLPEGVAGFLGVPKPNDLVDE